jgi:hypothetical protein
MPIFTAHYTTKETFDSAKMQKSPRRAIGIGDKPTFGNMGLHFFFCAKQGLPNDIYESAYKQSCNDSSHFHHSSFDEFVIRFNRRFLVPLYHNRGEQITTIL